ncbi:MAG: hypothetical protein LBT20_07440 [Clostridiales bacterium]|jgi:hypothetical protein|nr:hypothetical protein [Clostridiales bacterium]
MGNETASRVKLADLADNMNLTRISNATEVDKERIKKYSETADRIMDVLPYADSTPNRHLVEVNGVAEVHPLITSNAFADMFIAFIEAHGWFSAAALRT